MAQPTEAARQTADTPENTTVSDRRTVNTEGSEARLARLRKRVATMRVRARSLDIPRVLMIAGGALLVLGLLLIGAAWYGAAHTPYLFEQIPYLISGGLLGLGLSFAGGAFYFAYWMTRQVHETKLQAERAERALARLEVAVVEALGAADGAPAAPSGSRPSTGTTASNGSFVATARGSMFHRPDCAVVAGRADLKQVSPDEAGLQPCRMCDPLGAEREPV